MDLLALILGFQQAGGPQGDYEICIDISSRNVTFRHTDFFDHTLYQPAEPSVNAMEFRPVRGTVVCHLGRPDLINSVGEIIDDAMNQAGATMVNHPDQLEAQLHLL